jgi:hypothetical protein
VGVVSHEGLSAVRECIEREEEEEEEEEVEVMVNGFDGERRQRVRVCLSVCLSVSLVCQQGGTVRCV